MWKIQLTITVKSNNNIEELFESLKKWHQNKLEESMKVSMLDFDWVYSLYYKFRKKVRMAVDYLQVLLIRYKQKTAINLKSVLSIHCNSHVKSRRNLKRFVKSNKNSTFYKQIQLKRNEFFIRKKMISSEKQGFFKMILHGERRYYLAIKKTINIITKNYQRNNF